MTCASWANPIEARFEPLRQFTIANSNRHNHTARTPAPHACAMQRPHPDVLAAEGARIRNEKDIQRGGRPFTTAA